MAVQIPLMVRFEWNHHSIFDISSYKSVAEDGFVTKKGQNKLYDIGVLFSSYTYVYIRIIKSLPLPGLQRQLWRPKPDYWLDLNRITTLYLTIFAANWRLKRYDQKWLEQTLWHNVFVFFNPCFWWLSTSLFYKQHGKRTPPCFLIQICFWVVGKSLSNCGRYIWVMWLPNLDE